MKKSNLYTFTGDKGTTSLVGGQRIPKDDARLEAYGTVDELNSFIGVLASTPGVDGESIRFLHRIQNHLFNIGAYLATDNSQSTPEQDIATAETYGIIIQHIENVEHMIDFLDSKVPPLNKFLIPGGTPAAAKAHVCRTVARRAERRIITLATTHTVAPHVLQYINRLSDYFFVLARYLNTIADTPEFFWEKD